MTATKQAPRPTAETDLAVRAGYAMDRSKITRVPRYWPFAAGLGGSTTLIASGYLAVTDNPHLVAGAIACTTLTGVATGVVGRGDVRREMDSALRASLERLTGPLRQWRTSRWGKGLIGVPRRIRLRYRPEAVVGVANWPQPVPKALEGLLGAHYVIGKHDPVRGLMILQQQDVSATDVAKDRSERVMALLFGDDVHVSRKDKGSGETLTVTYSNVVKAADPGWRSAIERVVDTALPGRWRAQWDLLNDQVRFEVRPALPKMLKRRPPNLDPSSKDFFKIPLGEDEDSRVVCWDLNSSTPHLLTAGKTGKGKTNLLLGVGQELSARQFAVWACDPKRIELQALRRLPNVQVVATTPIDMAALVMAAYDEMERRYKQIEAGKARKGDFPRLIILIDEYAEFVMRVQNWWASVKLSGMPTRCPVLERFETLLRLARAAQMNIITGIQRPDVKFLPGEARDNFDARCSLGPLNRDGSEMMWGSQVGCTTGMARGRAMAADENGDPVEIQTYWTPDRENDDLDEETLALLDSFITDEVHPKLRVSIPAPDVDDKGRELWWDAIQDVRMIIDDTPAVDAVFDATVTLDDEPEPNGRPKLTVVADSLDDDYGKPVAERPAGVQPGDLYWRDEADAWVQVQAVEPDPLDDGLWNIAWQDEDGDEGTDLVPDTEAVRVRHVH